MLVVKLWKEMQADMNYTDPLLILCDCSAGSFYRDGILSSEFPALLLHHHHES